MSYLVDMESATNIRNALPQFTGTQRWFRHPAGALVGTEVLYTEGAKYLADAAEAYWLLDLIVSYQKEAAVKAEDFQVWKFKRGGDADMATKERPHRATMTDGNGETPIVSQAIEYTDFPLPEIELWAIAEGPQRRVILLPSEY